MAEAFYQNFNQELAKEVPVETGVFGADMQVELVNDGAGNYHPWYKNR